MILRRVFCRRRTAPEMPSEAQVEQRHYMALYDYKAQSEKDISFKKGEILEVTKSKDNDDEGWWNATSEDTHDVGYIPSNYVTSCESPASLLTTQDWFFGSIRREEAERILLKQEDNGSFLIRGSELEPGNFCLSVRDGEIVKHYVIRYKEDDGYFILPSTTFPTLCEFVRYYQQTSDGIVVKLSKPCPATDVYADLGDKQGQKQNIVDELEAQLGSERPALEESGSETFSCGVSESTLTDESVIQQESNTASKENSGAQTDKSRRTEYENRWTQIIRALVLIPVIAAFVIAAHINSIWEE